MISRFISEDTRGAEFLWIMHCVPVFAQREQRTEPTHPVCSVRTHRHRRLQPPPVLLSWNTKHNTMFFPFLVLLSLKTDRPLLVFCTQRLMMRMVKPGIGETAMQ